jgi:hypothetical protein
MYILLLPNATFALKKKAHHEKTLFIDSNL